MVRAGRASHHGGQAEHAALNEETPMSAKDLMLLLEPAAPAVLPAPGAGDEPDRSCGWYDSSYDLGRGLQVIEHNGFEWLDAGLPLALWLQ
jgi:hypothetical protein